MTAPYYQDDQVTLYLGDCLEITEWLTADVLVTDPPYGIAWCMGQNKRTWTKAHEGITNDHDTTARDTALQQWGPDKPSIVFGSFRACRPVDVKQTLIWKKPIDTGVVGSTTGYRNDTELIFLRGPHIRRTAMRSSVLESHCGSSRYRTEHPHSKPVAILEQLIEWTEGTIADPFAGSGSTLVAARNLGRKAIGVEIEERYCEIVAKRLDQLAFDFGDHQ
ncbi:Modification methylase DpnIIB [Mycobacterium marinum]|uniref:DNA-methyltransferase n=1 Tax=Mycobacterium marinum TaxID=1781 RepID=UPI000E3BD02C|nr:DNA methyltransferase [Mycobacterium marinum]RFZ11212.1 Modification methylase DpnIIB [Mycobacterium marinum]